MGLIIPAFVPSTLHEIVEYQPSMVETQVSAGIWAWGFLILTVGLKIALPILRQPHPELDEIQTKNSGDAAPSA